MIDYPLIQQLGLVLLHFLWQGALIGLLFSVGKFLARSAPAATRYNWAVLCLALLALAPLVSFFWLQSSPEPAYWSNQTAAPEPRQIASIAPVAHAGGMTLASVMPWIVTLWLFGVVMMSARLGAGWWYVTQLRRRADSQIPMAIQASLNELAGRLKISRPVGLALSAQIAGPMLTGLMRPLILLPAGLINGLSARQVEMVLAHELAHLKRADHLVNAFQTALETLLFYHPVVRWISSEVRAQREMASDELAALLTGDRVEYAETLLELEKIRADRLPMTIGMADHQLLHRVRHLLTMRSAQSGSITVGVSLLIVLLVSLTVAALSASLPSLPERDLRPTPNASSIEPSVPEPAILAEENPRRSIAQEAPRSSGEATASAGIGEQDTGAASASTPTLTPDADHQTIEQPKPSPAVAALPTIRPSESHPEPAVPAMTAEIQPLMTAAAVHPEPTPTGIYHGPANASKAAPASIEAIGGGKPLYRQAPSYPPSAARNRLEGQAEVRLSIGPDGQVVSAALINEHPAGHGFGEAALEAVREWRFEPFTLAGRPIQHELQTGFDFTDPPNCGRRTGTRISRC